jgi:hypothetical protein
MGDVNKALVDAVKPFEFSEVYFVQHAYGSIEFFDNEADAFDRAIALGRPYYPYNAQAIEKHGDRIVKERVEWEEEMQDERVSFVLSALTDKARAAIAAAQEPWVPPEDRPDGFRCIGRIEIEWASSHEAWTYPPGSNSRTRINPASFAPLPPAPEDKP